MPRERSPVIVVNGVPYLRIAIQTTVVTEHDDIVDLVDRYTRAQRRAGDILVVSESVVAISQGRAIPESQIHVGLLARLLWRGVRRVPYGIGLRSASSMQCAINECGALRILAASLIGFLGKLVGRRGDFYRIAGMQAATIDAAHTSPVEPYDQCVILGPKNPEKVARAIWERTGCDAAVMDVNDIGGSWALGFSPGVNKRLIEAIMRDNPLGQKKELTPIGIIRRQEV
jgi:F420-0:gamma-glutamyl ligase-like protein